MKLQFTVHGTPAPAGSKSVSRAGRVFDNSKRARPWRTAVAQEAGVAMNGRPLLTGPLKLTAIFYRQRPKSHFRANGMVKEKAPLWPIGQPDTTKLVRGIEDAMKGVVYIDDSLIVKQVCDKEWGNDRCEIIVEDLL